MHAGAMHAPVPVQALHCGPVVPTLLPCEHPRVRNKCASRDDARSVLVTMTKELGPWDALRLQNMCAEHVCRDHACPTPVTMTTQLGPCQALSVEVCVCRDDARSVLVTMTKELGREYLPFILDVLESALPPRGYMAHVLGFTLHAVLAALVEVPPPLCTTS